MSAVARLAAVILAASAATGARAQVCPHCAAEISLAPGDVACLETTIEEYIGRATIADFTVVNLAACATAPDGAARRTEDDDGTNRSPDLDDFGEGPVEARPVFLSAAQLRCLRRALPELPRESASTFGFAGCADP